MLLLLKILQTKTQVKKLNYIHYDLYFTIRKNRDGKEIINDKYKNIENDYSSFEDLIIPNHYIGRKNDDSM